MEIPMKATRLMAIAAATLFIGSGFPLHTAQPHELRVERADPSRREAAAAHVAPLRETVTVAADKPIPNVPGKRLVSLIVDYPPGASSASHRHSGSAFIYAHVLSGEIRSAVDGEPARVYRAGESWFESPGAHHRVSANASDAEPARLLAVFIVDADEHELTMADAH
jgi:quercetin dioxygenase-like cupin family protein